MHKVEPAPLGVPSSLIHLPLSPVATAACRFPLRMCPRPALTAADGLVSFSLVDAPMLPGMLPIGPTVVSCVCGLQLVDTSQGW